MRIKFFKNIKAVAAVEFALTLPILLLLYTGCFELTRYIIIQEKVGKTAASVSDLVSRSTTISETDISNIFASVQYLMEPYYTSTGTEVIIYSVTNYGNGPIINWVRTGGGSFYSPNGQSIGSAGGAATLPAGFSLSLNEETIICEVYYNFIPIIGPNIVGSQQIHKLRFTKPRLGALNTVTS